MNAFRRTTTEDPIPEDLKPYYQGKNTAWQRWVGPVLRGLLLLSILGLLVWGGIWGVNKLVGNRTDDSKNTATSSARADKDKTANTDKDKSGTASGNAQNTTPAPTPAPTPSSRVAQTPAPTPAPQANPTPTPTTPAPAPTPTPTPSASTSASELANTGPREAIVAFFVTVVVATFGYYFFTAYRVSARHE